MQKCAVSTPSALQLDVCISHTSVETQFGLCCISGLHICVPYAADRSRPSRLAAALLSCDPHKSGKLALSKASIGRPELYLVR